MNNVVRFHIQALYIIILILSLCSLTINYFIYKYPGNNYLPLEIMVIKFFTTLVISGIILQFSTPTRLVSFLKESFYYVLIVFLLLISTCSIQFTPFSPVDGTILQWDLLLGVNLKHILEVTNQHPLYKNILELAYDSLGYQLTYFCLLMIAFNKIKYLREFYFLLLISTLIGFTIYYFFPTTAPASIIDSPLFTPEERATGIKFYEIHHQIPPSTQHGGMISFPSFHVIWAWLCSYLVRGWKWLFIPSLALNSLVVLSCVALGWHYVVDLLGSAVIIFLSHFCYWFINHPNRRTYLNVVE